MTALILRNADQIQIEIPAESLTRKTEALATASAVTAVTDAATQGQAASALRTVAGLLKAIEDSRQSIKAPVLEAGRQIDATARQFAADLEREKSRLSAALSSYEQAERRKREEAERQRQAELRRIEEARLKAEREAQDAERRRQAEAARIEREWLEAEQSADRAKAEELRKQQEAAEAESKRQQEAEAARQLDLMKQQQAALGIAVPAQPKPSGMVVRQRYDFEVLDIWELAQFDRSLVRIEPNRSEIIKRINAEKEPLRKCSALVIFPEMKVGVRA